MCTAANNREGKVLIVRETGDERRLVLVVFLPSAREVRSRQVFGSICLGRRSRRTRFLCTRAYSTYLLLYA